MDLKEILFSRTQAEFRTYYNMAKSKYHTDEERERQRAVRCCLPGYSGSRP